VLYERLILLGGTYACGCKDGRLESTLQRGSIKQGYSRTKASKHSHVMACFQLVYIKLYWFLGGACAAHPRTVAEAKVAAGGVMKPVAIETYQVVAQCCRLRDKLKDVDPEAGGTRLSRETLDLESLYYATMESLRASCGIAINTSTFFSFFFLFVPAQIFTAATDEQWSTDFALVATGVATVNQCVTASIAVWWFCRVVGSCLNSMSHCWTNKLKTDGDGKKALVKTGYFALFVAFTNAIRVVSAAGSAVSSPWFFASMLADIDRDVPLYVAMSALALHAVGLFLRFIAEYSLFWGSDPKLGNVICDAFASVIFNLKMAYSVRKPSTVSHFVHERKAFEYVARVQV